MTSADIIALFKKQPVGFACAVISLILAGLIYYRSDLIGQGVTEYEAKSDEAHKILDNVRNSENLAKQVAEMQTLSKQLEGRLIRANQLAVNLQYFYKLEAENDVKLLDVRQGNSVKSAKLLYLGIPYSVSVQGSYKQVIAFLQRLDTGPHFCHFSAVEFVKSAGTTTDASGTVSGIMTLNITLELLGLP